MTSNSLNWQKKLIPCNLINLNVIAFKMVTSFLMTCDFHELKKYWKLSDEFSNENLYFAISVQIRSMLNDRTNLFC